MIAPLSLTDSTAVARVEGLLLRVRWVMWILVVPIAWIDAGLKPLDSALWIWLGAVAILNVIIGIVLRFAKKLPARMPAAMLIFDSVLFGILPHILASDSNLLVFFALFPALVGAVRFGPAVGLIVAGVLALPIEARAAVAIFQERNLAALSAGLSVAAVIAATALIGILSQHEKQAYLGGATQELTELRTALAGAQMLYKMTDVLRTTTSYEPVFEAMLDAGVKGLFQSRQDDEPNVGVVLLVDELDPEGKLRVVTHRQLERRDTGQRLPGKAGVIADAIQSGKVIVFENISDDPELSVFSKLRRCRAGVCFPLQAGLEVYGVAVLATPAPRRPSPQLLDLMRAFANQAAFTFQNATLYRNLRVEHEKILRSENEMRQKLARDLHDGPTQQVAALVMQMEFIGKLMEKDPAEAKRELEKASEVAQAAVKSIRTALFTLRPIVLETKGLSAALEQLAAKLREKNTAPISMDGGKFGTELDVDFASTVFAIMEEAIGNALKHAPKAPVAVRVGKQEENLVAFVQDQGPGFDVDRVLDSYDQRTSLGMLNMRERAKLIDGELRIDSALGRGTRITLIARLPAPPPSKQK